MLQWIQSLLVCWVNIAQSLARVAGVMQVILAYPIWMLALEHLLDWAWP